MNRRTALGALGALALGFLGLRGRHQHGFILDDAQPFGPEPLRYVRNSVEELAEQLRADLAGEKDWHDLAVDEVEGRPGFRYEAMAVEEPLTADERRGLGELWGAFWTAEGVGAVVPKYPRDLAPEERGTCRNGGDGTWPGWTAGDRLAGYRAFDDLYKRTKADWYRRKRREWILG